MKETTLPEPRERPPFPPWLRELCYFGGIIISLTIFGMTMKSDQRSQGEKLDRMVTDVGKFSERLAGIEGRLPNKEAEDLRFKTLEEKVDKNYSDLDFKIAKLEKWKDDTTRYLIKKGVID